VKVSDHFLLKSRVGGIIILEDQTELEKLVEDPSLGAKVWTPSGEYYAEAAHQAYFAAINLKQFEMNDKILGALKEAMGADKIIPKLEGKKFAGYGFANYDSRLKYEEMITRGRAYLKDSEGTTIEILIQKKRTVNNTTENEKVDAKSMTGYDFWLRTSQEFKKLGTLKQEEFVISLLSQRRDNFNLDRISKTFNMKTDTETDKPKEKEKETLIETEKKPDLVNPDELTKLENLLKILEERKSKEQTLNKEKKKRTKPNKRVRAHRRKEKKRKGKRRRSSSSEESSMSNSDDKNE